MTLLPGISSRLKLSSKIAGEIGELTEKSVIKSMSMSVSSISMFAVCHWRHHSFNDDLSLIEHLIPVAHAWP